MLTPSRRNRLLPLAWACLLIASPLVHAQSMAVDEPAATQAATPIWPPALPGADTNGVLTLRGPSLLEVPASVTAAARELGFDFMMATTPPVVELVYHNDLADQGVGPDNGTGWTAWGDICVARDGSVYCAIGDHGPDGTRLKPGRHADAHVHLYRWQPASRTLRQVASPNQINQARPEDPHWSKIHARIFEDPQGRIIFIPTFNDGQRSPDARWTSKVPSGQVFAYDPQADAARVIAILPDHCATATTQYDRQRNILYINLEGQFRNALYALDLATLKPIYQGPTEMIGFNRNMAISRDGVVYYNAANGSLGQYDPATRSLSDTAITFPNQAPMRSSTAQASDGWLYATLQNRKGPSTGNFVRFNPATGRQEILGFDFLAIDAKGKPSLGNYTTVSVLSPDEKYVYYLPGAHGGAVRIGTPVVQYDIARRKHKVIAFLRPAMEAQARYTPGGTYGVALSADGGTLYVNLNGHAGEGDRLPRMKPNGFGLTAFAAIHIPPSER